MKPREIFGLAVRILGVYFLYLSLSAVSPLLNLETIENADRSDIVNAILPIAFNLVVAWWLLGGGFLMRRAYPDAPKTPERSHPQAERTTPSADSTQPQGLTDMDRVEKRLAPLVEKPKDIHPG
jgi:hypothetical protein